MNGLYNPLSDYLKEKFGCRVFKVTLNAGLTCPNRDGTKGYGGCVYCEPAALMPPGCASSLSADIESQLVTGIEKVRKRHKAEKFIAYFQINTNTYSDERRLRDMYAKALERPEVAGLAISTRPDCLGDNILKMISGLEGKKHLWVELGLQSSNDITLERINRGHTAGDFEDAVKRAGKFGIDVCAHIILGLPGEGRADILNTVKFVRDLGLWGVKFHQLQVIKGTRLEEMYDKGAVVALGLEEYAELVVECLENLPSSTIIHRLCGDMPESYLVAPRWGANKFVITEKILTLLSLRGSRQGRSLEGDNR